MTSDLLTRRKTFSYRRESKLYRRVSKLLYKECIIVSKVVVHQVSVWVRVGSERVATYSSLVGRHIVDVIPSETREVSQS